MAERRAEHSGLDVFRAYAEAYEAGGGAAEERDSGKGEEDRVGAHGGGVAEEGHQHAVSHDLERLGEAGGELAAVLDLFEGEFGDRGAAVEIGEEGLGEDVGGGDGILDGEVDADASDGGHGVGGVADAEEAGGEPAFEMVDLDGKELDLIPGGDLVDAVGEERRERDEGGAEGGETGGPDGALEGAFADDEAGLEVVGAVDEDEHLAEVEEAEAAFGIVGLARKAEPEDVDGSAGLDGAKVGGGGGGGVAAVAADGESGGQGGGAGGGLNFDSGDAVGMVCEAGDFVLHEKAEGGVFGGLLGQEVEEIPLRHERDEATVGGEMGEVGERELLAADDSGDVVGLLVGELEERVKKAELVHELEGGGVDGVSAEVPEEVLMLFQNGDGNTGAGEEKAEHHAGGAAADDAGGGGRKGGGDRGHADTITRRL
jgi:hypothetical protein